MIFICPHSKKCVKGYGVLGLQTILIFFFYIYVLKNFISKGMNKREKNPMEFTMELNLDNGGWSISCQCAYAEYSTCCLSICFSTSWMENSSLCHDF